MHVIIENVTRFPTDLLHSFFGDLHAIDGVFFEAKDLGALARRLRLYVVMTLRGKLALSRPLADFVRVARDVFVARRSWETCFLLKGR